jgi:DNA-binding protein H-NS
MVNWRDLPYQIVRAAATAGRVAEASGLVALAGGRRHGLITDAPSATISHSAGRPSAASLQRSHPVSKANLDDLSLTELKKLQRDIARAIDTFDARQKQGVLAALEEKAKELGFALSDLFSSVVGEVGKRVKGATRTKPAPKYANPSDPSVTWSGRGRRPRWFSDAIAAGTSPDEMAV